MGNSTTKTLPQSQTPQREDQQTFQVETREEGTRFVRDDSHKIMRRLFSENYRLVYKSKSLKHDDEPLIPNKEKVYNFENMSTLEEHLPDEIMIHILQFLPLECIKQLGRVSKNFYHYWIDFPQWWKNTADCCSMLYLPERYENNTRRNIWYYHSQFKPTILNAFKCMSNKNHHEHDPVVLKFVLAGAQKSGKSILADRIFKEKPYEDSNYFNTIGVEFRTKVVRFYEEEQYAIQLWDMGGDQKYNTILRSYFREARAYFYCFDLGDHSSFENTLSKFEDWKSQYEIANVYEVLESTDACLILLGLKADLPHQVDREEVYEFLEKIIPSSDTKYLHTCRVQYFELSSKRDSYQDLILPFIYGCSVLGKIVP